MVNNMGRKEYKKFLNLFDGLNTNLINIKPFYMEGRNTRNIYEDNFF